MSPELDDWIQYWFPLVGLTLPEPEVTIRDTLLSQPTYGEWARLEKRDVADLRQYATMREALGEEVTNTLPVCIVILADPRAAPDDPDLAPFHALWPTAQRLADSVLYGLWLHKRGNILPPELFGLYIDTSDGFVSRQPGWYRQELPGEIDDGYVLTAADVEAVEPIAELVGRYHAGATNLSADLALENLRASYGWHASPIDRLAVLFAGLEAVFAGYNARDQPFGRVPLPVRAAVAADDEHVESFLAGRGRELRNAVAHGNPLDADDPVADVESIRDILRRGLARYLAFCVDPGETGTQRSPMIAFNLMLAAAAG